MAVIGTIVLAFGCSNDDDITDPSGWQPPTTSKAVYAQLIVERNITYMGVGEPYKIDSYEARFDGAYAPRGPIQPIGDVIVSCNDSVPIWNQYAEIYTFPEAPMPMRSIITPGAAYTFAVSGGSVPGLTRSIVFPSSEPYITYPTLLTTLDRSGFNITWAGSGSGIVELTFLDSKGQIIVFEETPNDGSYSISSTLLSGLPSGECAILLNYYNRETIMATGYDSRSFIAGRIQSQTMFDLE